MSDRPNHVLIITVDQEALEGARDEDPTVDPHDPEFWEITVQCNADLSDYTGACMTWWQCDCEFTEDQWHQLANEGEGPCPDSPTGKHQSMFGTRQAAKPSQDCWAQICDDAPDAALYLASQHKLRPGEYPIYVHPDDETVEFELAEPAQTVTP